MAITSPGTVASAVNSVLASSIDLTHETAIGTELLVICCGFRGGGGITLDTVENWDTGQTFTEQFQSSHAGGGDCWFNCRALLNPTIQTNTITFTLSGTREHQWAYAVNYAGVDTASLAAAINVLQTIDNPADSSSMGFSSAGNAGNCLAVMASFTGDDGSPASVNAGMTEFIDTKTGGGHGGGQDAAIFGAHILNAGGALAPTITWGVSDAFSGNYLEIVAASGAAVDLAAALTATLTTAANLKGPGALNATQAFALSVAANLSASGKLEAATAMALTVAADLKAAGNLQGAVNLTLSVLAGLNAAGGLNAVVPLALTVAAVLNASGQVAAALSMVLSVAANITDGATADLAASIALLLSVSADVTGSGALASSNSMILTVLADLRASGRLDAVVAFSLVTAADLRGAGNLAASLPAVLSVSPTINAPGSLASAMSAALSVSAALTDPGAAAALPFSKRHIAPFFY